MQNDREPWLDDKPLPTRSERHTVHTYGVHTFLAIPYLCIMPRSSRESRWWLLLVMFSWLYGTVLGTNGHRNIYHKESLNWLRHHDTAFWDIATYGFDLYARYLIDYRRVERARLKAEHRVLQHRGIQHGPHCQPVTYPSIEGPQERVWCCDTQMPWAIMVQLGLHYSRKAGYDDGDELEYM